MARKSRRGTMEYLIVQHSDIIQKSQHALTEQQQNILYSMVANVRMDDTPDTIYKFSIKEFAEDYNLDMEGGFYYKTIRDDIDYIDKQRMWLVDGTISIRLQWLNVLRIDNSAGIVEFSFHQDIRPYIFELQDHFTQVKQKYTAAMTGRYVKKLYVLLKSYEYMDKRIIMDVDRLRFLLDAEAYSRYNDFRRFILIPAINQINSITDIEVTWDINKMEGRKVKELWFDVRPLNDWFYDREKIEDHERKIKEKLGLEE